MSNSDGSIQALLGKLIEGLEDDPHFEVEAFLHAHPGEARVLRERLEKLRGAGLLGARESAGAVLREMRERFGVATVVRSAPRAPGEPVVELLPSRVVGERYRILAEIGRGGMGRVFRALDLDLQREVALKVVDLQAPSAGRRRHLERFLTEAQLTAQLEHPSIVPLHDIGLDRTGQLYYTMKLVEGRTLEELICGWHADLASGKPFPLQELLRIVLQICDALALAHERDVIHRDLKPSNVMLGRFGEVHVMDWGLAKLLAADEPVTPGAPAAPVRPESPTRTGDVLGTPSHMAPEQARGDARAVDHRADVYGVGAILHHALLGVPPNGAAPAGKQAHVPPELRAICRRALRAAPDERYQTVAALAEDVRAFRDDRRGTTWRDGWGRRLTKWTRRNPAKATGGAAGIVLALLCLSGLVVLRSAEQRAQLERERSSLSRLAELLRVLGQQGQDYGLDDPATSPPKACVTRLAAFREAGFALDGPEPLPELIARFARVKELDPGLHADLQEEVGDLVGLAIRAQLDSARRFCAGTLAREVKTKRELWLGWGRDYAPLLDSLPRLWELDRALQDDPWRLRLLEAYRARFEELAPWPDDLLSETPPAPADKIQLALCLTNSSHPPANLRALELFHDAGATAEGSYWAQFLLGDLEGGRVPGHEDLTHAIEHTFRAVALSPRSFRAWSNLGACLSRSGRDEIAAFAIERAFALRPEDPLTRANLVKVLTNVGLAAGDRAAAIHQKALSLTRVNEVEHSRLAEALLQAQRTCVDMYRRALAIDPTYVTARCNLANSLSEPAAREEQYRAVLELEPCNFAGLWSFGDFLDEAGRVAEQVEVLARLVECPPERADAFGALGRARHEWAGVLRVEGEEERGREQMELAISAYQRAVLLRPDDFYSAQNLGLALVEAGREGEALAYFEDAVQGREADVTAPEPAWPPEEHAKRLADFLARAPLQPAATAGWAPELTARMAAVRERARALLDFLEGKN